MLGRICQGLSGAFIMPASLALIKTYWDGAGRQRAVSLWSMGSWGGSGFAALFGGLVTQNVGWRWIFFASAAVSLAGMLMVRGTPESKTAATKDYRFDTIGVLTFMVTMVALQVLATQGGEFGWTNPILERYFRHLQLRWRQADERLREEAIDGRRREAANEVSNLVPGHPGSFRLLVLDAAPFASSRVGRRAQLPRMCDEVGSPSR
jgi:hypothetical protein